MSRLWTDGRTECKDRARILETEFAIISKVCVKTIVNVIIKIQCETKSEKENREFRFTPVRSVDSSKTVVFSVNT